MIYVIISKEVIFIPKRKTLPTFPEYVGSTENEKLLIQKSNPLLTLSETSMTLPELKILDAYLARINSHEPEKRQVKFEKGELEELLGITRMHREELSKRIRNLFQVVTIQDERKPDKFECISLFEKAKCEQDEDGLWNVNLVCSSSAMEYIFNVESLGYLKYRLKNVVNLTSRYSYVLYLFLEDKFYIKNWRVDLDELKKMLNCNAETYDEYKRFNDLILKKCKKEINQKTTINFEYVPIKKGRKVVAIEFKIKRIPEKIETATEIIPAPDNNVLPDQSERPSENSDFENLTQKEIELLCDNLGNKLPNKSPEALKKLLKSLYNEMLLKSKEPVKKPVSYLLRMIDNLEPEKIKEKTKKKHSGKENFCIEMYELSSKRSMLSLFKNVDENDPNEGMAKRQLLNEIAELEAIIKEKTGKEL